jgi:hypothetical protein
MTTKAKKKRQVKHVKPITVGKPVAKSLTSFFRNYTISRELRNGFIVRHKRTSKLLKVYGDKQGRTIIEPYSIQ